MSNASILIAEDDIDDRFLLKTAFSEKGYKEQLTFVENGLELIDYLQKQLVDNKDGDITLPKFILLDLNMPKKDGREVLKEIKQDARFKIIPVIVFTTNKNENEIKRCYELGANTYVVKPTGFESLLEIIDGIMTYWLNTAKTP